MTKPLHSSPVGHVYFSANDIEIHALQFGAEHAGPPLLLLHGVTGSAWQWHDVAVDLAQHRRVLALDLRGHGLSGRSADQQYTTADHVRDLTAVIEQLDVDSVDLAGASWGALIAMTYAAAHPDQVGKLGIVDVEPSFEQDENAVHPRPEHFERLEDVVAWERKANPAAPDALLGLWARQSVRHDAQGGWTRQHDAFFYKSWPFRRDDLWSSLSKLTQPALLVHGKRSFVREDVMRKMAAQLPNARLECIEDSGHVVPLEAPAQLGNFLKAFFNYADVPEDSTA